MSTITVYVNSELLSILINATLGQLTYDKTDENSIRKVVFKESKLYPYEIQIPISAISQFFPKERYANINLGRIKSHI